VAGRLARPVAISGITGGEGESANSRITAILPPPLTPTFGPRTVCTLCGIIGAERLQIFRDGATINAVANGVFRA